MLSVKLIQTDEGPQAVVMIGEQVAMVSPDAIRLANGVLHIAAPLFLEAPEGCTVIERPVEPTPEQVRLMVEALPPVELEAALIDAMDGGMNVSMADAIKAAVGVLLTGYRDLGV